MPEDPQASKIRISFDNLSKNAASLNAATDEMNSSVRKLEAALAKLNLGITSWAKYTDWGEPPYEGADYIGYTKWGDKWCVCIRQLTQDYTNPDPDEQDTEKVWAFTDAPRHMRIAAVPHLHKMIEKLNEDAAKTWQEIAEKAAEAETFAEQIVKIADATAPKKAGAK